MDGYASGAWRRSPCSSREWSSPRPRSARSIPDEGVLMYRGYDIADLAEHSTYEETALLLLDGEAPVLGGARGLRERAGRAGAPERDGRGHRPLRRRQPRRWICCARRSRRSRPAIPAAAGPTGVRPPYGGAADRTGADDPRPLPPPPPGAGAGRARPVALLRGELPRDAPRRAAGRGRRRAPSTS